jgi:predicted ATP-dependent protease
LLNEIKSQINKGVLWIKVIWTLKIKFLNQLLK